MKHYVYIHLRKDNLEPFYVGKGTGYRYTSKRSRNKFWNNIVNKHGYIPIIYERFEDEKEAFKKEAELILLLKSLGKTLTNMTEGGEGAAEGNLNLLGHKHSEKTKQKISAAVKGRKHSEETKQKIAEANARRVWSKESKEKAAMSAKNRNVNV